MEPKDFPLYMTLEKNSFIYRIYACTHFSAIIGLIYYRIVYIPNEHYWPWIVISVAELGFAYGWILEQAFRWRPVERKVFPQRLSERSPEAYFSASCAQENENLSFSREWKRVKKLYLELKDRINNAVEMGSVPQDKQKEHTGFKDWISGSTRRDHPSIVQILLENGEDKDIQGNDLPSLIYVSREKRPGIPHHYKTGALNVLIRISGVMSNAPFILTLDCDMYTNNSEALRQAMCFFLDPKTGHQFAFVQFPQGFNGITKNDLYANDHLRICYVQFKGVDGLEGPIYAGTGCIHRRDALCGREGRHTSSKSLKDYSTSKAQTSPSKMLKDAGDLAKCACEENTLWGKEVGMIYGCAVEDALTGFVIQCRGWKSIYCNPRRKAFLGGAPVNMSDTLIQIKRWSAGYLEFFLSKFCPYVHGIQRTSTAQSMCYGVFCLWAPSSLYILCYGLLPALFMFNGLSLFPKASNPWFILFAWLAGSAYGYSLIEFLWIGGSFKSWWNEQRMWMIKGVSSYLFALIQVACKMLGVSEVGFEVTSKVVDREAAKRHEEEIFEFGVASAMFVAVSAFSPFLLQFLRVL